MNKRFESLTLRTFFLRVERFDEQMTLILLRKWQTRLAYDA